MQAGSGSFRGAISNVLTSALPANLIIVSGDFCKLNALNHSVSNLEKMNYTPNGIIVSNNTGRLQAPALDGEFKNYLGNVPSGVQHQINLQEPIIHVYDKL